MDPRGLFLIHQVHAVEFLQRTEDPRQISIRVCDTGEILSSVVGVDRFAKSVTVFSQVRILSQVRLTVWIGSAVCLIVSGVSIQPNAHVVDKLSPVLIARDLRIHKCPIVQVIQQIPIGVGEVVVGVDIARIGDVILVVDQLCDPCRNVSHPSNCPIGNSFLYLPVGIVYVIGRIVGQQIRTPIVRIKHHGSHPVGCPIHHLSIVVESSSHLIGDLCLRTDHHTIDRVLLSFFTHRMIPLVVIVGNAITTGVDVDTGKPFRGTIVWECANLHPGK